MIQSKDYKYNKGSEWRKWDLHIHTKGTNKNDQFVSPNFDSFCVTLFRKAMENDIEGLGITDYFSIENYKKVVSFVDKIELNESFTKEEKKKIKKILILPNVELRLLPSTDCGRLINIHCLFNPVFTPFIENDFFASIEYAAGSGKKFKMNKQGITDLGNDLIDTADNEKAYIKGINSFAVNHSQLQSLIDQNSKFRENVIIAVSNSNKDGASAMQKHFELFENEANSSLDAVRKSIYKISDCIFSSNENDINYFLGKKSDTRDTIIKKCGSLKPCIHGSDAHSEEKLFNPDQNRYCWIKADLTFEGLKQILCEPEGRVKIQNSSPKNKKSYNIIEKVKFIDKTNRKIFPDYEIGFNPDLNTIIGGKSSGKSLLMHLIAKAIGDNTDTKEYTDIISGVELEVYYADEPNKKRTIEDGRIIEFLPQLYIEKIVQGKSTANKSNLNNPDYFNTFISDLIQQDDDIKDLFEAHTGTVKGLTKILSESISEWIKLDKELIQAKKELLPLGDKTAITNEILNIEKKIKELTHKSGLTPEEIKIYQDLTIVNTYILKKIADLNIDETEVNILIYYAKTSLIPGIYNSIKFETKSSSALLIFEKFKELLKVAITKESSNLITELNLKHAEIARQKTELDLRMNTNLTQLAPILEKNKIQDEIKFFELSISKEKQKITTIEEKEKEINELKTKREANTFIDYYSQRIASYNALSEFINKKIAAKWEKEQTKLTLTATSIFNETMFVDSIGSIINLKSYLENQFENCGFNASNYNFTEDSHIENIKRILKKCITDNNRFDNFKAGHNTEELLRAVLKDCNYIDFDIKKGEDSLRHMSEGKKGIVILQLFLSLSKADYPILIDQPEDNLDNRTVYIELNDYIKKCKERRQIILVSHNANLVVNTDAENIIVANQMGEDGKDNREFRFEYVNGALENTFINKETEGILYQKGIREHVCEILEGGTDAFKKREEKYHLSK